MNLNDTIAFSVVMICIVVLILGMAYLSRGEVDPEVIEYLNDYANCYRLLNAHGIYVTPVSAGLEVLIEQGEKVR